MRISPSFNRNTIVNKFSIELNVFSNLKYLSNNFKG